MPDIKSMQELRKVQQEFSDRLEQQLKLARASKDTAGDVSLERKTQEVVKAQAALAAAVKERDSVVKFWVARVERLRSAAASRADEVKQVKKQIAEAKKATQPASAGDSERGKGPKPMKPRPK
jgi:methyl-accepting chemotaxis protein